ncbi:MAG TPA: RDD family protein [Pseudonocardia sp.]|jgi:uncharacterized RDD family membrane protein YckC|nr:RDD family protein [Pseudonocardia sp.]
MTTPQPGYQGPPAEQQGPGPQGPPSQGPPPGYQPPPPPGYPPGYQAPRPGYQAPPPGYGQQYAQPQGPPADYGQQHGQPQGPPPGHLGQQAAPGYQQGGAPAPVQQPDIADWWQRLVARIIDGVGFMIVQWTLTSIFYALFGPSFDADTFQFRGSWILPAVLAGVVSGLLYAGYDYYMHGKFGATLGKMALKLKLAQVDRSPVTQAVVLKRALLYPGVFALTGLIAGLGLFALSLGSWLLVLVTVADGIFVLIDQTSRQSLHDRLAGTVVLKTAGSPTIG